MRFPAFALFGAMHLARVAGAQHASSHAAPPGASQVVPRLALVPGLRLSAATLGIQRDPVFAVGPGLQLVAAERFSGTRMQAFDSTGAPLQWNVPTGRRDDAEIMFPIRMGWIGSTGTVWVGDQGYHQVALIGASGKVTKSIEYPSWIHPHWAERRKYPLFGSMEALAVYPDSTMLVLPGHERSIIDVPAYDRTTQPMLRVSASGAIERIVARVPNQMPWVTVRGAGRSEHTIPIPMAARTFWDVTSDGARIVIVTPGTTLADSGTYRVTVLSDRGDTVFSRQYPQAAVRVRQGSIDTLLAGVTAFGASSAEQVRASVLQRIPLFRSMITGVLAGHDHSVWVLLRAAVDTSRQRTAVLIDPRGELRGMVDLPPELTPVAGDATHLWLLERGRMRLATDVTRYDVVPAGAVTPRRAPPARIPSPAASSRAARPPA